MILNEDLETFLNNLKTYLIFKNEKKGDSELNPERIFVKTETNHGNLDYKIDSKISSIKRTAIPDKQDIINLIGYLVVYCVYKGWLNFDELYTD